jgi:hypothetical protein
VIKTLAIDAERGIFLFLASAGATKVGESMNQDSPVCGEHAN